MAAHCQASLVSAVDLLGKARVAGLILGRWSLGSPQMPDIDLLKRMGAIACARAGTLCGGAGDGVQCVALKGQVFAMLCLFSQSLRKALSVSSV